MANPQCNPIDSNPICSEVCSFTTPDAAGVGAEGSLTQTTAPLLIQQTTTTLTVTKFKAIDSKREVFHG